MHGRDGDNLNNSGPDDCDDNSNARKPPRKLAKIPLNQQFPPNSFEVFPVFNDQGMYQHSVDRIRIYYHCIDLL